ncbi:tubulin-folding cofactor B [Anopheles nili]|uniref:tubulin-folding cofactor B n=1 Tax=Anopheles nili TaxID=185578 RepID=UPI00237B8B6A|nr:tubulin-folding cofactor B [Anopheles nili]
MSPVNNMETSEIVTINVSNSQNDTVSFERKYPRSMKVYEFKMKLEPITGASADSMKLELYSGNRLVSKLEDDTSTLAAYPIEDGMRVHVVGQFMCMLENVAKFELSQEEYDKKSDSVRSFLKRNKLGKFNEEEMAKQENERRRQEEENQKKLDETNIGDRCRVTAKNSPIRFGTVMYKGPLEDKPGVFIGVKFDEPLGVNDGSMNGKRYFDCDPKYGSFVAPKAVEVGDFPPIEFSLDDEL